MTDEDTSAGAVFAFAPMHNREGLNPRGRPWRDADEFRRHARAFVRMHGGRVVLFDNRQTPRARAEVIFDTLADYRGASKVICVAHFGHGWANGIEGGFDNRGGRRGYTPAELAAALASVAGRGVILPLFSCSAADAPGPGPSTDGGFCDELRDACCRAGLVNVRVDGHTTVGHTTHNPFLVRFEGGGSTEGGAGGEFLVAPPGRPGYDARLWRAWRGLMANEGADFDLLVPFLETDAIRRRVREAAGLD